MHFFYYYTLLTYYYYPTGMNRICYISKYSNRVCVSYYN